MQDLLTKRLILRPYADTLADIDAALALYGDPETLQFIPLPVKTREQAAEFVARQAAMDDDQRKAWHAFVICRKDTRAVIGEVGMFRSLAEEATGDVGFMLRREAQGQGYATEAAAAMIRYGFVRWGLRRVTGRCDARNSASQRVLERIGMRRETEAPETSGEHGSGQESYTYVLSRDEWLVSQNGKKSS